MSCFSAALEKSADFKSLSKAIGSNHLPLGVTGLSHIHKAHIIHSVYSLHHKKGIVLVSAEAEGHRLQQDLQALGTNALIYPVRDFSLRDNEGQSKEYEQMRLNVLGRMSEGDYDIVIAPVDAALQYTIPPEELKKRTITIDFNNEISLEKIISALLSAGYVRSEQVEGSGQFAARGGIVDFFPPDSDLPVRVELWGDSVDSMAYFEIESQRRTKEIKSIKITPSTEILCESFDELAKKIEQYASALKGKAVKARANYQRDIDMLLNGIKPSLDKYLPLIYEKPSSLMDYADDYFLFVSETAKVKERLKNSLDYLNEDIKELFEEGVLSKGLDRYSFDFTDLLRLYEKSGIYLDAFPRGSFDTPIKELFSFNAKQLSVWSGSLSVLKEDIEPALKNGYTCIIMAGTEKNARSLAYDLEQSGITATFFEKLPDTLPQKQACIISGGLSAGAEYPDAKLMIITHGRPALKASSRKRSQKNKNGFSSLDELHIGDYVVHSIHGIGIFDGIHKIEVDGVTKDYIKIKYDKEDILYVPVTQLDLVSKYIAPKDDDGKSVKLNRIGGNQWQKTRAKVRSAIKDIAKDLIKLYAQRMNIKGYQFSPDTDMQSDFERRFEFDETEDQLRCINEIKHDMERPHPMDRLLCGDVGFGKTEVALRAAFKCLSEGKQCAMLVPTTILAYQHFQTITKRFDGFPVSVEMLSRFRTPSEQKKIMNGLRRGNVDMVVGTHRLISKDIQFNDLGLLIIDEEQRFGVAQKEKLKEKFPNVDVLTLSATPIPRTLNMAMSGLRDMSTLEEAPQDRHPVQTYVLEHNMGVLAAAMEKELRRGGQVYYLHNRVEDIERTALIIKEFLPEANIGIAHGKMTEDALSEIWRSLLNGDIDILVCTTIIETGVDVPNVNTLIIEDADRMGLAQLHQIRGRVGRSTRRASAYFTFRRGKELTEIATRRLTAIREFTEFGSGFKIAMRDLEIRGAGNVLGAQQHGHMAAVGYDMYLKLLSQAIAEERGETPKEEELDCLVDLQIEAHIPDDYIQSIPHRLAIYRRIADIRTQEDADDVIDELVDRFGDPPKAVEGLIKISLLRNISASLGIYEIGQRGKKLILYCKTLDMKIISRLSQVMHGRVIVNAGVKPYISVEIKQGETPEKTLSDALKILKRNSEKNETELSENA
ncbi:MAG: transcription-repair coupling factor [Clostridiales bacterium]|nr:transcription-repair coupling factor [Clostridiales bacterium]